MSYKLTDYIENPSNIPCKWLEQVEYVCPLCKKVVYKAKRNIVYHGYNCYKCNQHIARQNPDFKKKLVESQKKTFLKNWGVINPGQIEKNRKISSETAKKIVKKTGGISRYFSLHKEECLQKRKETWIKKYGVDNPSKSTVCQKKRNRKYFYDNMNFDSAWEVAFYIYCKDKNYEIKKEPYFLKYIGPDLKEHRYFPDFEVNGKLYELKGDVCFKQFIDSGKYECAKKNNVKIYYFEDMKPILYYVSQKYGSTYIASFRKDTKEE
jgi:hypothetical protein